MNHKTRLVRQLQEQADERALRLKQYDEVRELRRSLEELSKHTTELIDENMALKGLLLYARPHVKAVGDTDLLADIDHYCGVPQPSD